MSYVKQLERALRGKKVLVFLDLEGTQFTHEMIEIGAYKVFLKDDSILEGTKKAPQGLFFIRYLW